MAATAETVDEPFTAFSFEVVLALATPVAGVGQPVCQGAFAECEGLQLELEARSVVHGGANDVVTHLVGQTRPGLLTLRRGMTTTADLWAWMAAAGVPGRAVTADGHVALLSAAHEVQATFVLTGCLPVRLRGPSLHAQTGMIAVEELGLAVGHLALAGTSPGGGLSLAAGLDVGIGLSAGASAGASLAAGAQVSGGLGLSGQLGGTFSATGSAGFGVG